MMETKSEMRIRMRSAAPSGDSAAIWRKIEALPEFGRAISVLVFWSIGGEPDTHDFIRSLFASGKRVLLPRVVGSDLEIREYSPDRMIPGYHGILEPDGASVPVLAGEVDIVIVPALAFDAAGRRLGRGKGYYDRLLPSLECLKVGVCFDSHIVEEVPVLEHDVLMDLVITPNNSYICSRNISKTASNRH